MKGDQLIKQHKDFRLIGNVNKYHHNKTLSGFECHELQIINKVYIHEHTDTHTHTHTYIYIYIYEIHIYEIYYPGRFSQDVSLLKGAYTLSTSLE